jgi:hypothetical protein
LAGVLCRRWISGITARHQAFDPGLEKRQAFHHVPGFSSTTERRDFWTVMGTALLMFMILAIGEQDIKFLVRSWWVYW